MAVGKPSLSDIKRAIEIGKNIYDVASPIIAEHGPEIKDYASRAAKSAASSVGQASRSAAHTIGSASRSAAGAAAGYASQAKQSRAEKQQAKRQQNQDRKAGDDERRRALAGAAVAADANEFSRSFDAAFPDDGDMAKGYLAVPGYFAILTMPSSRTKDAADYKDVYVGGGALVGLEAYRQLSGFGNVDVYADFKFKRPMRVLVFLCDREQVEERAAALAETLGAADSYNKWDSVNG